MAYGLLLIRIVFGVTLAAHGAQKLFGWLGGEGPDGTAAMFAKLEFRLPMAMAMMAGLSEFGGGLMFAAGLLTPLAAFAVAVPMLSAIAAVHGPKGFWSTAGGYEFNLAILAAVVAIAATGPGRFSLDNALGWEDGFSGVWWGVGEAAAGVIASLTVLAVGRAHTLPPGSATEQLKAHRRAGSRAPMIDAPSPALRRRRPPRRRRVAVGHRDFFE